MKILLIDPPGKNKGFNTGLGYLSATLSHDYDVNVLDLNNIEIGLCGDPNKDMPIHDLEERINSAVDGFEPQLIGISVKTFTANVSKHILKFIKTNRPKIITVAGGPHITLDGFKFIHENRIDFGVQGEGEYTALQLCNALDQNRKIEHIDGLFYWRDSNLVNNPKIEKIKDLDSLSFPCYDTFSSVMANGGHLKEYPLLTSRGCPYSCSYCSMPRIMGKQWRSHSATRVMDELQYAKKKYSSTSFTVVDDNLTLNLKRVEEICDRLISAKINLRWSSQNGIRADRINQNLAKKMKRSGCTYVWVGIESADEKVFNSINKGEQLEDIKQGIRYLKKAGIGVGGFFIIGLPFSTKESDLKAVEFAKKLGIDGWWFNFIPYPHTQAWDWVQANGKMLRPCEGALQYSSNSIEPVFETEEYPRDERIRAYNEIHVKLSYFDRLVDPSLNQWKKWPKVYKKVCLFDYAKIVPLLLFITKYIAKLVLKKIRI